MMTTTTHLLPMILISINHSFSLVGGIFYPLLLLFIAFSILYWTCKNGISPMPTSPKVQRALLNAMPDQIEGTIVELGSGWGTLAFALARRYPNAQVIGYETSHIPYLFSLLFRRKNLTFVRKDFFKESLQVTVAICYLYPTAMQRLKEKLESEGEIAVITHTFAVNGWKAKKIVEVDDLYKTKIYFYNT